MVFYQQRLLFIWHGVNDIQLLDVIDCELSALNELYMKAQERHT